MFVIERKSEMPIVTAWYPATTNPLRIGYYEVLYANEQKASTGYDGVGKRYWDGKNWRAEKGNSIINSFGQEEWAKYDKWRGLAQPPNK